LMIMKSFWLNKSKFLIKYMMLWLMVDT
jgi:hypothetical protein